METDTIHKSIQKNVIPVTVTWPPKEQSTGSAT
jgi:hypothetical protein